MLFLVRPVLTNRENEFSELYGLKSTERTENYQLTRSFVLIRNIDRLMAIFNGIDVAFKKLENVYNVADSAVLSEKVEKEILLYDAKGVKMYEMFIDENIKGTKSIWDKMSKINLKTFTALKKEVKVKIKAHVMELME